MYDSITIQADVETPLRVILPIVDSILSSRLIFIPSIIFFILSAIATYLFYKWHDVIIDYLGSWFEKVRFWVLVVAISTGASLFLLVITRILRWVFDI